MSGDPGLWRIGELSRRVGVSTSTLRSWESRYELLRPQRSAGNYRLYSSEDEARVRRTLAHIDAGLSTAEAAVAALVGRPDAPSTEAGGLDEVRDELIAALEDLDEQAAGGALDRLFAMVSVERGLREVILPTLRVIGERWEDGRIGVGEEHFASNILLARLQALASGWRAGPGPAAVLACAPGELHSIGLACLALGLRSRDWTVLYLGQNTPPEAIERSARRIGARLVVISAADSQPLQQLDGGLELPGGAMLAIGGAGADESAAARLGARLLDTDPLTAAELLSSELR